MANGTCEVEGCGKTGRLRRGWCDAHYQRWRMTGDVLGHVPLIKWQPMGAECSAEDCAKPPYHRGWCRPHYRRWQNYGDPLGISPLAPCAWPKGCDKQVWVAKSRSGMCADHAERTWKKTDPQQRQRVNARNRRYAQAHPEKKAAWGKKYRDANPAKQAEHAAARRARLQGQFVERVYRSVVFKRDKGICGICRKKVDPANWHLDHIVPISQGGEHSYANTQVTHPFCNVSKGAKLIEHQMALL